MFSWTLDRIKLNDENTWIVFLYFMEISNKKTPEPGSFKSFLISCYFVFYGLLIIQSFHKFNNIIYFLVRKL